MHQTRDIEQPLTSFVFQLILPCAAPKVIADVSVNKNYAVVTRGEANLGAGFDLSQCYGPPSDRARRPAEVKLGQHPHGQYSPPRTLSCLPQRSDHATF
jgi:hypothetical protein